MREIFLLLFVGFVGCKEPAAEGEPVAAQEEPTIANVQLTDLQDQPINLDQYKGKTVFINFWATWCKPCIQEIPSIESTQQLLSKHGVVFLLASNESFDEINEFKKNHPSDLNYVRVVNMEELSMEGLPTTYIYNSKGKRVFAEMGYRKWDDTKNIEMILKINDEK